MGSERPESSKQPIEESLANYRVGGKEGLAHLKGEGSVLYGSEAELESYRRPLAERGPREGKSERPWFPTKHGRTGPRLWFPITLRSLGVGAHSCPADVWEACHDFIFFKPIFQFYNGNRW